MSKQVFINLPVSDLAKSTAFYEALGFTKNPDFSDENASSMMWSDEIVFMLLTRDFFQKFLANGKTTAHTLTSSAALIALTVDSREAVQQFADTAKANGGSYHLAAPNEGLDFMCSLEVQDPDGNVLEPVWMDPNFDPQS